MKSTWKEMAGKIKECASVVAVFKGQVKICLSLSFNTKKNAIYTHEITFLYYNSGYQTAGRDYTFLPDW